MPLAPYGSSPLDRKSLGQRLLSTLVPQLQSFRFQRGQGPLAPVPGPVAASANNPGFGPSPAGGPIGRVNPLRGRQLPRRPAAPASLSVRPATQPTVPPTGLSPALASPAPTSTSKMDAEAGLGGERGFDMQAFIRYLASLAGQGAGAPGIGASGSEAAAGNADAGGRGFA